MTTLTEQAELASDPDFRAKVAQALVAEALLAVEQEGKAPRFRRLHLLDPRSYGDSLAPAVAALVEKSEPSDEDITQAVARASKYYYIMDEQG